MTVDRNFQASFQNDHLGQFSITMRFQGQPNLAFLTKFLIIKVVFMNRSRLANQKNIWLWNIDVKELFRMKSVYWITFEF